MQFEKIHNKGQAQLFKNPYLEMLTKTHPLVIWGMYTPVMIYMLYYSGNSPWFLNNTHHTYFFRRYAFLVILRISCSPFFVSHGGKQWQGKKFVILLHGNHHHYPRDKQRLFMPPVPSLILASAIFGLMYLLLSQQHLCSFPGSY
jgi:hypothetical protein